MSRKDTLKAMLSRREHELPPGNSPQEAPEQKAEPATDKKLQHIRSGAVGAMSRSLGHIASAADQAMALIANGAVVVDIPTDRIDGSFVADRLADDGDDYQLLRDAIRDAGQKSPILVRPHPNHPDRYQIAFGHRRVRVLASLGRPVKAIVQNLSDDELVVIQGQENSARADLSYIERALFALALEAKGFDRRVIMSALTVEKTQLSRLLALAHAVPRTLVEAIGRAPKAGRPRWMALSELLNQTDWQGRLEALLDSAAFRALDSDARFARVMTALTPRKAKPKAQPIDAADGRRLAVVAHNNGRINLIFDAKTEPAFADYVAGQLAELHAEYLKSRIAGDN